MPRSMATRLLAHCLCKNTSAAVFKTALGSDFYSRASSFTDNLTCENVLRFFAQSIRSAKKLKADDPILLFIHVDKFQLLEDHVQMKFERTLPEKESRVLAGKFVRAAFYGIAGCSSILFREKILVVPFVTATYRDFAANPTLFHFRRGIYRFCHPNKYGIHFKQRLAICLH